jgi:2-keto-4-pentenoate hydratase/2-oxohepta-3-ene-1,7-dioic acid hydratase in catechol pathway
MRLVTYRHPGAESRAGLVVGDGSAARVVDLAEASGGSLPPDLLAILEAGRAALEDVQHIAASGRSDGVSLDQVELLAPLVRPRKILAAAGNYQGHIVERGLPSVDKTRIVPKLFIKPSTTVLGPDGALVLPAVSDSVDWEIELAVVIGCRGRDIELEHALEHVAGYSIVNDISARTMQWGIPERDPTRWDAFFDWLNGKWPDGFAPMGPWIVTADEIADPQALQLRLSVNGEVYQNSSTAEMLFGVAELLVFASRFMTLEPGDVFATGTPAGVGATTGRFLHPGDVMEGWIEGIGTLRTPVVANG